MRHTAEFITACLFAVFGFGFGALLIYRGIRIAFERIDDGCALNKTTNGALT